MKLEITTIALICVVVIVLVAVLLHLRSKAVRRCQRLAERAERYFSAADKKALIRHQEMRRLMFWLLIDMRKVDSRTSSALLAYEAMRSYFYYVESVYGEMNARKRSPEETAVLQRERD